MGQESFGIELQAFQVLEKQFQDVLSDLAADQSLEQFRFQFEKLHRALKISHDNQKRLLGKCRDLSSSINDHATKVQTAIKMTQDDNHTISFLKTELDKIHQFLQLSRDRQEKSRQRIENLQSQINNLNQLIARGAAASTGPTSTVNDLISIRDQLMKECELYQDQIQNVDDELKFNDEKIKQLSLDQDKLEKDLDKQRLIKEELEQITASDAEEKKNVQRELEKLKKQHEETKVAISKANGERTALEKDVSVLNQQNNNQERQNKELLNIKHSYQKKQKEEEDKRAKNQEYNDQLKMQIHEMNDKVDEQQMEIDQYHQRLEDMQKQEDLLKKECDILMKDKMACEHIKDLTNQGINQLQSEIQDQKRIAQEDRNTLQDLRRGRDILQKELNRAQNNNRKINEDFIQKEKIFKEKKNELSNIMKRMDKLNSMIKHLEKEKEKYSLQCTQANGKYFFSLEEIKLKDNLISEFQKKNIETEAKLKQQQNLYEAVRSDRNLYSQNLAETTEEIQEIKRRFRTVNHQINQLKEEIDAQEIELVKEHNEHKRKDTNIEEQSRILLKYKEDIKEKNTNIEKYMSDISQLHFMIKESEQQRQKLKEEYELVVAERDILGTQLIRRNTEASLLYEQIKINQSMLKKGEVQYVERMGDIIILKNQIADLINEIKDYQKQAKSIADFKTEIHSQMKELTEEQLKVKSLSEELENPMNVHRWRQLQATDSETYELMTQIQSLQKRLISKTEEVIDKDQFVQDKEKELQQLRDIMKRQPGIEEEQMIPAFQESLQQKTKQLRAMTSELQMYQSHLSEYKLEIDRLNKDLQETKQQYFDQKKREQIKQQNQQMQQKAMSIQINLPDQRFTGGGFNLVNYS